MASGWTTYGGVVHVHTEASGGAPFEEILGAAREAGIDYILLTDSHTDQPGDFRDREGWHDGVLVLVGQEVCREDGQFLALDTRAPVNGAGACEEALAQVRAEGGAVAGTHYHFREIGCPMRMPDPLPVESVDIVEIWSFHDEFLVNGRGKLALQFQARPEKLLNGPPARTIREWDRELARRHLPAIGSVSSIRRKEPLLEWKTFFPLRTAFETIRTHVLCPDLPQRKSAAQVVWRALRRGNSYIVNHALGEPEGFRFEYLDVDQNAFTIGETVPFDPHGILRVNLPHDAEVVIRLDGVPLFWGTGQCFHFPAPAPGVYRLEARVDRRCWILTNPIRVMRLNADTSGRATVVDFT